MILGVGGMEGDAINDAIYVQKRLGFIGIGLVLETNDVGGAFVAAVVAGDEQVAGAGFGDDGKRLVEGQLREGALDLVRRRRIRRTDDVRMSPGNALVDAVGGFSF